MSEVDRTRLPIRRKTFEGVINRTLDGSQPDWNLIGHPTAPEGAPNVLLVLIDDAGFGNPSTFGGPIQTPNYTRVADGGVRYNRFHVTASVLADARGAAHRSQQPRGRLRVDRRVRGRIPGLLRDRAPGLRAAAPHPSRQRLQHGRVRQVAPDAGRSARSGRAVRPVAERLGLRLLLRDPRGRFESVGSGAGREPEDHRDRPAVLRRRRSVLLPGCDGGPHDRVVARSTRAGRAQAVLRVLLDRMQPRTAPRGEGMGGQVQGPVRPGMGQAQGGDVRRARSSSASSRPMPSSRRATTPSRPGTTSPTSSRCSTRARWRCTRATPRTPTTTSVA